jgi:hypothetical protein
LPRRVSQRESAGDGAGGDDRVEPQEEQQTKQRPRHGCEEWIVVHVRARAGEQRRKEQRLHHDIGVRVAREPHLHAVEREEQRGGGSRRPPEQPRAEEIHRQHAEDSPRRDRRPRAGQPEQRVADRDRRGVEVRELPDDRSAIGIEHVEAHEARREILVRRPVAWQEQIARKGRHRRDDGVRPHDRAVLRDLHAFVQVDARILPADHILGWRQEAPARQQRERDRDTDRGPGAAPSRAEPQIEPRDRRRSGDDRRLGNQQALEAVAMERGHREHEADRECHAEDHFPVRALLSRQRRTPLAVGGGQAEQDRARHPDDRGRESEWQKAAHQNWK